MELTSAVDARQAGSLVEVGEGGRRAYTAGVGLPPGLRRQRRWPDGQLKQPDNRIALFALEPASLPATVFLD
jgi:hypothetical protein